MKNKLELANYYKQQCEKYYGVLVDIKNNIFINNCNSKIFYSETKFDNLNELIDHCKKYLNYQEKEEFKLSCDEKYVNMFK